MVYKLFQVIGGVFFHLKQGQVISCFLPLETGGPPSEFQLYIYGKLTLDNRLIVGSTIVHRHEFLWKIWKAKGSHRCVQIVLQLSTVRRFFFARKIYKPNFGLSGVIYNFVQWKGGVEVGGGTQGNIPNLGGSGRGLNNYGFSWL